MKIVILCGGRGTRLQEETEFRRWLVKNLNDHCDIFVAFPELPRLHIGTGKDTWRGLDVDDWMLSASNEEQTGASTVLSQHSNACEVYNPDLVNLWNVSHKNWDSLPQVRYLRENFKAVDTTGQFTLLVRNDRNLDIQQSHSMYTPCLYTDSPGCSSRTLNASSWNPLKFGHRTRTKYGLQSAGSAQYCRGPFELNIAWCRR
jgi:hypothetical protein